MKKLGKTAKPPFSCLCFLFYNSSFAPARSLNGLLEADKKYAYLEVSTLVQGFIHAQNSRILTQLSITGI